MGHAIMAEGEGKFEFRIWDFGFRVHSYSGCFSVMLRSVATAPRNPKSEIRIPK